MAYVLSRINDVPLPGTVCHEVWTCARGSDDIKVQAVQIISIVRRQRDFTPLLFFKKSVITVGLHRKGIT